MVAHWNTEMWHAFCKSFLIIGWYKSNRIKWNHTKQTSCQIFGQLCTQLSGKNEEKIAEKQDKPHKHCHSTFNQVHLLAALWMAAMYRSCVAERIIRNASIVLCNNRGVSIFYIEVLEKFNVKKCGECFWVIPDKNFWVGVQSLCKQTCIKMI